MSPARLLMEGWMRRVLFAGAFVVLAVSVAALQTGGPVPAHFHHVHVNSTDAAKTQAFYQTTFGAQPVRYKDKTDGLFVSRGFILINKVAAPPKDLETTAIRHIGWAGV